MRNSNLNFLLLASIFIAIFLAGTACKKNESATAPTVDDDDDVSDDDDDDLAPDPTTITWVEYKSGERTIRALYRSPTSDVNGAPGLIYNHGLIVGESGYEEAAARGYDVADFVNAFAEAGFATLAPIRPPTADLSEWGDFYQIIIDGYAWLAGRPETREENLFTVGFSAGGLLTLQTAQLLDPKPLGVVLMSPADGTGKYSFAEAASDQILADLAVPFMITMGAEEAGGTIAANVEYFLAAAGRTGLDVTTRLDYPGAHPWFWQVRKAVLSDIVTFLDGRISASSKK